jgi:alkylated DNA repair protein (DNA oxidative demethylase)
MTMNLFDHAGSAELSKEDLCPGAYVLRGFALSDEAAVLDALRDVTAMPPFATWLLRAVSRCQWR